MHLVGPNEAMRGGSFHFTHRSNIDEDMKGRAKRVGLGRPESFILEAGVPRNLWGEREERKFCKYRKVLRVK